MDPNSVSENNASAPIAPPEYRPTQSTLPKRTGIKLLIIVIVSGVALAAIGYILMGVLGAFMIGNFLNIATHKPTANETAAACRILTSAIYDIEQALEKEKFTERGVSYKCEGATFGLTITRVLLVIGPVKQMIGREQKFKIVRILSIVYQYFRVKRPRTIYLLCVTQLKPSMVGLPFESIYMRLLDQITFPQSAPSRKNLTQLI